MNVYRRLFCITMLFLSIFIGKLGIAWSQESHELSGSGGGRWENQAIIIIEETAGLKRVNEPVEITFASDKAKPQGEDLRVTDEANGEIPCQVSVAAAGTYKVAFFAQVDSYSSKNYRLHFGNPRAIKPDYPAMYSAVDNQAKTWQTNDLLVGWGGKAGFSVSDTNLITTLKFDHNGDRNPANDLDCLTDDCLWDWCYGYFTSSTPGAFGAPEAEVIESGPVYCEISLGDVRVRCYKDEKWIMACNCIDYMVCYDHNYQFMKHGLGDEMFVPNWGPGDIWQWLTGYESTETNPRYLAFRNPTNGLVFGAVATDVAKWHISAKYSGIWDRYIILGDNAERPDARVYWYADTSNNYDGIEHFSQRILNPLRTSIVVDVDPPVTGAGVTPELPNGREGWFVTPPEVSLSSSEESSSIYYRFDSDSYIPYSSVVIMPEGAHDLYYRSIDAFGNYEQEKHFQVKTDYTKPEITASISPSNATGIYIINRPTIFCYSATDSVSGINSVNAVVGTAPVQNGESLKFGKPGEYTFTVNATDRAGNEASKTETFTVGYDFKWLPPVKKKADAPGQGYIVDAASIIPFRFQAVDGRGRAVTDKSVKLTISDGENMAYFTCGKGSDAIRINSCDGKYQLNVDPGNHLWLRPGGKYTISVYFGGVNGDPGICYGSTLLQLQ